MWMSVRASHHGTFVHNTKISVIHLNLQFPGNETVPRIPGTSLRQRNRALLYSQWDPHLHTDPAKVGRVSNHDADGK